MTEKTTKPPGERRSRYGVVILCLLLVNAVLIGAALFWLYRALERFETGTPATALARYFERLERRDFDVIHEESGFTPSRWNHWEDYDALLMEQYGAPAREYSWRRGAATTGDGGQVYAVSHGEARVGELALYENQGADGGWLVRAQYSYDVPSYTVYAPGHVTVYVNGSPLTAEEARASTVPLGFSALPQAERRPLAYTWEVEPMLRPPAFTAKKRDGAAVALVVDEAAHTVTASAALSEEQTAEYAARLEEVAGVYAGFVSEDIPKSQLLGYLYPDTDFYSRMRGYDAMWYIEHDSYSLLDLEVFNIVSCSDTCFAGEVSFVFEVRRGSKTDTFPSHYQMMFTQVDGRWLLVELKVL